MARGLQVFNAIGALTFDAADYLFRFVGVFDTGTAPGSITVAAFTGKTGVALVFPQENNLAKAQCRATVSGATLSWDWPSDGGNSAIRTPSQILYGVKD